ncbi:hypothetical protein BH20VER3_BH20VER3_20240 [soil metagenome]
MLNGNGNCVACLVRIGFDESATAEPTETASLTFGDFEVARREDGSFWELGHGAMGVTYRATDMVLHRRVALKVIDVSAAPGGAKAVRERFLREARAAAALRHPNVAGVFHFGAAPELDRCYYAMELVEGETLEMLVRREGPVSTEAALEIGIQVARALIAAGAQNLIHRDLKPANIMLTPNDSAAGGVEVKVIDFGLAKVTGGAGDEMDLTHGGFVGTPTFASPEQFAGKPADARSDIYSLGVTLWYALTGEVPCPGQTIEEIRHRQRDLPLPVAQLAARKIPKSVTALLRRVLAVDPARRPASPRELLAGLESCRARLASPNEARVRRWAAVLLLTALVGAAFFTLRNQQPKNAPAPVPDKSIAVLPFENRSTGQENAFFADGVQDEVLTDLAKIADLRVISRTSVMRYKSGAARNLREIGEQLGVAHLVEGSVQRLGNKVRVNAQLIDARTDRHLWAQIYDRDVADIFAIQSEIAQTIAAQLQARLSPNEKAAIEAPPTADLAAYFLYVRAVAILDAINGSMDEKKDLSQAADLLNQAIQRDPAFLLAYCRLANAHDGLYLLNLDHTEARRALAETAVNTALRLNANSGEAHLALASHLYANLQFDRALAELAIAQRTLPNNPRTYQLGGLIKRRQGHWKEALANQKRALELDPRNDFTLGQLAVTYSGLRNHREEAAIQDRVLALQPDYPGARITRAMTEIYWHADTGPLHAVLDALPPETQSEVDFAEARIFLAMCERDAAGLTNTISALRDTNFWSSLRYPRAFGEGWAALLRGDTTAARAAFTAARLEQEKTVGAQPDWAPPIAALGLIDAHLRRKEEAIREGRRAVELLPIAKDAMRGPGIVARLAMIYAWTGEKDLAVDQRRIAVKVPNGPTYGELKLLPDWDPLRGDPRFEAIVASLAPKAAP